MRPVVIFFRGLNTFGTDLVQLGPYKFGIMWKHLLPEMDKRGVELIPVLGLKTGLLSDITERAEIFLDKLAIPDKGRVHFFGHSAGGLVAKNVLAGAPSWKNHVLSLTTIATPHRGSYIGRLASHTAERSFAMERFFRSCGYDLRWRKTVFENLEEEAKRLQNASLPSHLRLGSVVCAPPRKTWSFYFKAFHCLPQLWSWKEDSDGLVEKSTQIFGEVLAEWDLDHSQQLGYWGCYEEFEKLCDFLASYWHSFGD